MEFYSRHSIGLKPIARRIPTFRHHALRGEVNHVWNRMIGNQGNDFVEVVVYVQLVESELTLLLPFVGSENVGWLR